MKALIIIPTKGLTVGNIYEILDLQALKWVEGMQKPAVIVKTELGTQTILLENVDLVS